MPVGETQAQGSGLLSWSSRKPLEGFSKGRVPMRVIFQETSWLQNGWCVCVWRGCVISTVDYSTALLGGSGDGEKRSFFLERVKR